MGLEISKAGEIALVLLGEVPAFGPRFKDKKRAIEIINFILKKIDYLRSNSNVNRYKFLFKRQVNGCYTLIIKNEVMIIELLSNIDELLLKRFQKTFRTLFILTCFYEGNGQLKCLAVTDGLGAVFYSLG